MHIQNISIYSNEFGKETSGGKQSFLGIGKKGQIVQGTISRVDDMVSINFNGIEVAVSKGAIKNAKEGEIRNFEIKDISKDSIILKEVENTQDTSSVRGMVNTSVDTSDYSFAECLEASKDAAQADREANESLSVLNGEDYAAIEEEEGSLTEKTRECVERAIQKRKERREWISERMEEGAALRKEFQESLEKLQANGFLSQKSEAQLRQAMQDAGIPSTKENLEKVVAALHMSQTALDINDYSKEYIIGQELAPTIENLYQGKYQTSVKQMTVGGEASDFQEYLPQIEKILQEAGCMDEAGFQNAKWLFDRELPINKETLEQLELLNGLGGNMTPDKVLEQIFFAMNAGLPPEDAVLDDSQFVVARAVIKDFQSIADDTIQKAAKLVLEQKAKREHKGHSTQEEGQTENSRKELIVNLALLRQMQEKSRKEAGQEEIPLVYERDMAELDILKVTMKRQLEEIRLKMTMQSVFSMQKKGIHIETEPLDRVIEALREMENAYYSQVTAGEAAVEPEQLDLLQESLAKTSDIAHSHVAILGIGVRQQTLLTMNELHAAAGSQTANRRDWQGVFETVSTQVRTDLGDSIQKAFEGIPAMLEDMGIERTEANERAVRILAYNGMEITEESIEQVKLFDAKVNRVIDNMKPAAVLELIRRGENPLDMPLDALNQELEDIQAEKGISSEERYSRFLWQMEKSGNITKEERMGYIGVYRLLNQLQKADGAAIGAVVETGQELTLGNLLKQVRTRKSQGMNEPVDERAGVREVRPAGNSITDQINAGFGKGGETLLKEQTEYYRHLAEEALAEVTPSKLQEMTDGDMERLLGVSLERFRQEVKQLSGNKELKKEYFEEQAALIREKAASGEVADEYLSKLRVENTIGNLLAAEAVLEEGYLPYQEGYGRKKVLSKERQQELDETIDAMEESIGEEGELEKQCEKAEKIMSEILTKSYEQADISLEDLSKLRILGQGIRLEGAIRRSRSYDIPIRTGDSITSLNLTIIHDSEESGRIQISMEHDTFGNISMDMKLSDGKLKGLVLCDRRQGFDALQAQKTKLMDEIEHAGYQVKNISYGMDFKSRNELLNEMVPERKADTGQLYQIAKILVRSITAVMREE